MHIILVGFHREVFFICNFNWGDPCSPSLWIFVGEDFVARGIVMWTAMKTHQCSTVVPRNMQGTRDYNHNVNHSEILEFWLRLYHPILKSSLYSSLQCSRPKLMTMVTRPSGSSFFFFNAEYVREKWCG